MSKEKFEIRHIGPRDGDVQDMLNAIGVADLEELIKKIVPADIRLKESPELPEGMSEYQYFKKIREIASKNKHFKNYIGTGYYNTVFPAVIQRNILENPNWYTSYTPYQAEISQGRLEALLNFQTVISDMTGMPIANASLLDEGTAAAEAMIMLFNVRDREQVKSGVVKFFVDRNIFPQTYSVLSTRAGSSGINLVTGDYNQIDDSPFFGAFLQFPAADGSIHNYKQTIEKFHGQNCSVVIAADLLSLAILTPPGEWGADVVIGSSQRFGLPMGYGGPHAGYFATTEKFKRFIPGRIIGISVDRFGKPALRMALQTREQHIRREKATSNICTAQALLAIMSGMYAVYHGPEGLRNIAMRCHRLTGLVADTLEKSGFKQLNSDFFDTIRIKLPAGITADYIRKAAETKNINLKYYDDGIIGLSIDETTDINDINILLGVFAEVSGKKITPLTDISEKVYFRKAFERKSDFLTLELFSRYRSETEMMRYIKRLERKDISLTDSMISLGSCTMKLNAAIELLPLSWPEFGEMHPFAPVEQTAGYQQLFNELEDFLKKITGMDAVSFQPNSGAAGEYAGLMVIRQYHIDNKQPLRNTVLIPSSAHGTNPASAVMAGMEVVVVNCDDKGNIDVNDLKTKAKANASRLAALMVTYPSTHGVFEQNILEITSVIHSFGGLVYMDGANMNAQVGITNPAIIGADICHLNLHKTFAIPHGGGGPGAGPICVRHKFVKYLPSHPVIKIDNHQGHNVSSAPWGSASILVISHAYCHLLGASGLLKSSQIAILNANYIAAKLKNEFGIVYTGKTGFVAHELILDCRQFKKNKGVTETDIAKRLMDYGFHSPTLSFPVHGTLMIEPTESESKAELDRFIEAMQNIYKEIMEVAEGADQQDNVLKNAPHSLFEVTADKWNHKYSREKAAFPLPWLYEKKYWTPVARIDDAYGDRNLVCTCGPFYDK